MSELAPQAESLETIELHGKSLRGWHEWLSRDDGQVPCSRYGRTGSDCAYWALAAEWVYCALNGEDDDPEVALEHLMGLAVNDHQDVLDVVLDHYDTVPEALKQYLDFEDNGLNMEQQAKLKDLCSRYGVMYDAQDYYVYPPGQPWMPSWAEGWVGGINHKAGTEHPTIYVGVSPEGNSHS